MWMWWLHEALAVAVDTTHVMVMNVVVWGRGIEAAVRGASSSSPSPASSSSASSSSSSDTILVC
jgi:hypothetical protein